MVNKVNVLQLAEFVERGDYIFNMDEPTATPSCGTAGCIGGHAAVLWADVAKPAYGDVTEITFHEVALAEKLGLDDGQLERLCFEPEDECERSVPYESVTREVAVATLKRLAETGELYFEVA